MANKFLDRVWAYTTTTGIGPITLGPALLGYQLPATAGGTDGQTFPYVILDGSNWETGTGVWNETAGTVTRSLRQSSTGGLLDLDGAATWFIDAGALDLAVVTGASLSWDGFNLTGTVGKTFTVDNSLTLAGTDGSTLNIGAGGTLGSSAYVTLGTGVATALAANVGGAGAFVVNGGALGTPSSGAATNLTGTAAGLTAGNVTTNANLTGPITSVGNATALAAQTGTGSVFVVQQSPSLTTPALGVATGASLALNGATLGSNILATLGTVQYQQTPFTTTVSLVQGQASATRIPITNVTNLSLGNSIIGSNIANGALITGINGTGTGTTIVTSTDTASGKIITTTSTTGVANGMLVSGSNQGTSNTVASFIVNTSITLLNNISSDIPNGTTLTLTPTIDVQPATQSTGPAPGAVLSFYPNASSGITGLVTIQGGIGLLGAVFASEGNFGTGTILNASTTQRIPLIVSKNIVPAIPTLLNQAAADIYMLGLDGASATFTLDSYGNGSLIRFGAAGGTATNPSAIVSGQNLISVNIDGYNGTSVAALSFISMTADENWSSSAEGRSAFFLVGKDTTTTNLPLLILNGTLSAVSLGGTSSSLSAPNDSLRVFTGGVNRVEITGAATGSPAQIVSNGTGTNAGLLIGARSTGTLTLGASGNGLSFFAATGATIQTVTGSKGGNVALASLMAALDAYGIVVDTTT